MKTLYVGGASIFLFFSTALNVQAAIYKCVNNEKGVYYIDKPCPVVDDETRMNAVQDPNNGYTPPPFIKDEEPESANKGIVVGRGLSKSSTNSMGDGNESQNFLSQENKKDSSGGGGLGTNSFDENEVGGGTQQQNIAANIIGNLQPGENEPLNIEELILELKPPLE